MRMKEKLIRKTGVITAFSLLMTATMITESEPVDVLADTGGDNAPVEKSIKTDDYFESRVKMEAYFFTDDLKMTEEGLKLNTPVHVTGKKSSYAYNLKGDKISGERWDKPGTKRIWAQVELKDGRIGYVEEKDIEMNVQSTDNFYLTNDTLVTFSPGKGKTVYNASVGETVDVKKQEDGYALVEVAKKKGYVKASLLTKKEPFYLYAKKDKVHNIGTTIIAHKGDRFEWMKNTSYDGNYVTEYLVRDPSGKFVTFKAKDLTFTTPKTMYTKSKCKVYSKASKSSSVIKNLDIGEKLTRQSVSGDFYKVKLSNGKIGYIAKSVISFSKIVKPMKSYGTWYQGVYNYGDWGWNNSGTHGFGLESGGYTRYLGDKMIRIDNKYYYAIESIKDSGNNVYKVYPKTGNYGHKFIKVQFADGKIDYVDISNRHAVNKKSLVDPNIDTFTLSKTESKKLLAKINAVRKKHGKKAVKWDDKLFDAYKGYWNWKMAYCDTTPHITKVGFPNLYMHDAVCECIETMRFDVVTTTDGTVVAMEKQIQSRLKERSEDIAERLSGDSSHLRMITTDDADIGIVFVGCNLRTGYTVANFVWLEKDKSFPLEWDDDFNNPMVQKYIPKGIIKNPKFDFKSKGEKLKGWYVY